MAKGASHKIFAFANPANIPSFNLLVVAINLVLSVFCSHLCLTYTVVSIQTAGIVIS